MAEEAAESTREVEAGTIEGCRVVLRRSVYFADLSPFACWRVSDTMRAIHNGKTLVVPMMGSRFRHIEENEDLRKLGLYVYSMEEVVASEWWRPRMAEAIRTWKPGP